MKTGRLNQLAAPFYAIAILFAVPLFHATKAQSPTDNDSLLKLNQQVLDLFGERKYEEALPLAEKLVVLVRSIKGDQDRFTATVLSNLGAIYHALDQYAKAEPLFREALEIRQKVCGEEDPLTATSLNNLALIYQIIGDYAKAEPLFREALEIRQKVCGEEDPLTATSLDNLAVFYQVTGDYAKAELLSKEALEIRQKVRGEEHPDTAQSLHDLGWLYQTMGKYAQAEPLYKKALEIRQKVLGSDNLLTAMTLNNLGSLYEKIGEYAQAEPLCKKALQIYQKNLGPKNSGTARSLNTLAELYRDIGDYAQAERLYKEALEIGREVFGQEHPETATDLNNLALLYQLKGEFAKAEALYKQALDIDRKAVGPEHSLTATTLNNLANLYQVIGNYVEAESLYEQALEIRRKFLGPEHIDTATTLHNLAMLYQAKAEAHYKEETDRADAKSEALNKEALDHLNRDYAKAELLYKQALHIYEKALGQENPLVKGSLNNLALLYTRTGEYAQAEPLYKRALAISQKVLGPENPSTAKSLNNLGLLYKRMGEYARAKPLYKEALEIREKVLGPENPDTAQSIRNLAYLELDSGNIQEAKRLGELGYRAGVKAFFEILSFGSEDQRLSYEALLYPYSLLAALDNEALIADAVLHYKVAVLDSIVEDRLLAEKGKEESNRDLVEQLNVKKRNLAQLLLHPETTSAKVASERIQTLEQQVANIEDKLGREAIDVGQIRRALSVKVEQVQGVIPKDAVLVEYTKYSQYLGNSRFQPHYGAVVLSPEAPPRWVKLGSSEGIESVLQSCKRLVRQSAHPESRELQSELRTLYKEVWEPVEHLFPANVNRVIVSPDGELNFLSFATLLDPENNFVAEKYFIQYVTSSRDLLASSGPTESQGAVVVADPDFNKDIQVAGANLPGNGTGALAGEEKRDIEGLNFPELRGTRKECAQLIPRFKDWGWEAISITRQDANKQALLHLHSPHILHLATHGFFLPEESFAAPDQDEPEPSETNLVPRAMRFFKNPMHRSGLALAGANSTIAAWRQGEAPPTEEDGILTAEDACALDLKGTWLVTLSACDTGSGESKAGEGVMGLRRGLVEAGAQNVLMTLWPINDEFTVRFMSDFYEAAHRSGKAPEALATIQREWLVKLHKEKGLASAVNLAGPFIMSSQGNP
jgi:tetratricopeptide (TPR) repeat protein